jgi:hypothetical protein
MCAFLPLMPESAFRTVTASIALHGVSVMNMYEALAQRRFGGRSGTGST